MTLKLFTAGKSLNKCKRLKEVKSLADFFRKKRQNKQRTD